MAAPISEHAIEFKDQFGTDADFDWTEVDKIMIEMIEKKTKKRKAKQDKKDMKEADELLDAELKRWSRRPHLQ